MTTVFVLRAMISWRTDEPDTAQQDPQSPWSLTGVSVPCSLQSKCLGKAMALDTERNLTFLLHPFSIFSPVECFTGDGADSKVSGSADIDVQ